MHHEVYCAGDNNLSMMLKVIWRITRSQLFVNLMLIDVFFFFQAEDGIRDLTVTGVQTCALPILAVLFIAGMIVASFWVLRPFLPAVVWATMIVVATWPLMLRVQSALWGRRGLAVAVMTVVLLLGLIVPLALALTTIVAHSQEIASGVQRLATWSVPPPPDWVERLALVGSRLAVRWKEVSAIDAGDFSA